MNWIFTKWFWIEYWIESILSEIQTLNWINLGIGHGYIIMVVTLIAMWRGSLMWRRFWVRTRSIGLSSCICSVWRTSYKLLEAGLSSEVLQIMEVCVFCKISIINPPCHLCRRNDDHSPHTLGGLTPYPQKGWPNKIFVLFLLFTWKNDFLVQ